MTPSEILKVVSETAQALPQTASGRTFMQSIVTIVDALSRVPDHSGPAFSRQDIAQLELNAENTIAAVEARIEAGDDREAVQLELATAIYDLRREMEEIDRWRRHYLGG